MKKSDFLSLVEAGDNDFSVDLKINQNISFSIKTEDRKNWSEKNEECCLSLKC